jgi:PEP-CTERM motif
MPQHQFAALGERMATQIAFRTALAAGPVPLTFASTASAAVIFEDDFDRADSNTLNNGWTEGEISPDHVSLINQSLVLKARNRPLARNYLDNSEAAYTDIVLRFDWVGDNNISLNVFSGNFLDPGEDQVFVTSLFGDGGHAVVSLPSGGNTYFSLRLEGNFPDETFRVDNVHVPGEPVVASVPEPTTLSLIGFGLLGLGAMARRRRYS